jgi:hypothetical protein
MDFAERWPVANIVETMPAPKPTIPTAGDGVTKRPSLVKREPVKKVAAHREAPPLNNASTSNYREPPVAPVTRLSLLSILKEQFEPFQTELIAERCLRSCLIDFRLGTKVNN